MRIFLKCFLMAFCLALALFGGASFYLYRSWQAPMPMAITKLTIAVPEGASLREVAKRLQASGMSMHPYLFEFLGRFSGLGHKLKPGEYEFLEGLSAEGMLLKMAKGDVIRSQIALIEGMRFADMRQKINEHPHLKHDTKDLSDEALMQKLGIKGPPEGRFFPDTYVFARQTSDVEIYLQSYELMQRTLAREWQQRAHNLPYRSQEDALIMASIIEKETGHADDRGKVAAVFVNRLNMKMRLQTDPSVIYGMGAHFDGNLRRRDLEADTPYNTYTRKGLPPTPIALPSLASLRAALHPEKIAALYFVAKGDGKSAFSDTLEEHNRAVNRYIRGRS